MQAIIEFTVSCHPEQNKIGAKQQHAGQPSEPRAAEGLHKDRAQRIELFLNANAPKQSISGTGGLPAVRYDEPVSRKKSVRQGTYWGDLVLSKDVSECNTDGE